MKRIRKTGDDTSRNGTNYDDWSNISKKDVDITAGKEWLRKYEDIQNRATEVIEKSRYEAELHSLLTDIRQIGGDEETVGLFIEGPYFTLSDVSDFSIILRNAFQDVVGLSEKNRRILDPHIAKITYSSPIIIQISIHITIINSTIISLGILSALISHRKKIVEIFRNFVKSSFVKVLEHYFATRKQQKRKAYGIKVFAIRVDKNGKMIDKVEIFNSLNRDKQ